MSARVRFKDGPLQELNGNSDQTTARSSKNLTHRQHLTRFPIQGKRIRLCFNGDRYSKPIIYSTSAFKTFEGFLKDVNSKVGTHDALFYGVRYIFDTSGNLIESLSDFCHNMIYVCASSTKFVSLNYNEVGTPTWNSTLSKNIKITQPSVTRLRYFKSQRRQNSLPYDHSNLDGSSFSRNKALPVLPNTELIGFLGRGYSAEVYKARNSQGKIIAVKVISTADEKVQKFVEREIAILKQINCDNIVRMYKTYSQKSSQIIEMEFFSQGDLFDYMKSRKMLDEYNCAGVVRSVASALTYLHSLSIVHRDVKPENLLVYFNENELLRVKLSDFGLATKLAKNELLFTVCGTPSYVAPEIISKEGYTFEVDLWSTGILMYLLLAGFPPFYTNDSSNCELFDQILQSRVNLTDDALPDASHSAKLIIRSLLHRSPKQRMKAKELLNQKWTNGPMNIIDVEEETARLKLDELETAIEMNHFESPLFMRHKVYSYPTIKSTNLRAYNAVKKNSLPFTARDIALDNETASFETSNLSEDDDIENGHDFVYIRTTLR